MGIVMNPIAFRIGHFFSWSDAWFVHRMYYPEFLHGVLLIKTLINFLFYRMLFIDFFYSFFLYSHMTFFLIIIVHFWIFLFMMVVIMNLFDHDYVI